MITVRREIKTQHEVEALRIILSDPKFVLPNLFKSLKEVKVDGSQIHGKAKFMGIEHELVGNVYSSLEEITFVFLLKKGNDAGSGKVTFTLTPGNITLNYRYDGWMDKMSSFVIKKWIDIFVKEFEEKVRLERINRKI